MSPLDSFLFIAVTVAAVWVFWLFCNQVADAFQDWYAAWCDEREDVSQTKGMGS